MVLDGESLNHALGVLAARVHLVDAVDVEGGHVDAFGIELARLDDLLYLCNHAFGRSGHVSVEVPSCLVELKVSHRVGPLGPHQSEISED
jgi:hypothetical protein